MTRIFSQPSGGSRTNEYDLFGRGLATTLKWASGDSHPSISVGDGPKQSISNHNTKQSLNSSTSLSFCNRLSPPHPFHYFHNLMCEKIQCSKVLKHENTFICFVEWRIKIYCTCTFWALFYNNSCLVEMVQSSVYDAGKLMYTNSGLRDQILELFVIL